MAIITISVVTSIVALTFIAKYLLYAARSSLPKDVKKLPGPKGLPFIGNVHQLPEKNSWMKFHEWGEQFGPIYQVNLAGVNHVWITRDNVARDLLTKRGGIYSDRPFIAGLEQDNRTSGQYLPLMSRNALWTRQRKFAKQIMDKSQKSSFYGYPELESTRLLTELMFEPSQYNVAMESYISRITSRLAWGTSTSSDELKQRARELLIGVSPSGALGNKLPFIMSLPEWLAPAKAWESRRSRTERKFFETMQQEVQNDIEGANKLAGAAATALPSPEPKQSWMRMFLENKKTWGFASDLEASFAVGMHGIAGALTIAAPMQSFCLAMCHYSQYQPILHEEIDRVLGDRMPTFGDMPDMPVLRAFIRETLRWRPPVPTGIPHQLIQDDIYEGYHIPAGSVMHPLEWSISRDPEVFPEPDVWNPLRWLDSDYPTYQEPLTAYPTITQYSQFGYGLRKCQGMAVTEADLFVGLGSVAWLFSLQASSDAVDTEPDAAVDKEQSCEPKVDAAQDYFGVDARHSDHQSWDQERPATPISSGSQTPTSCVDSPASQLEGQMSQIVHERFTMQRNDSGVCMNEDPETLRSIADIATPPATSRMECHPSSTLASEQSSSRPVTAFGKVPTTRLRTKGTDDPTMNFSTLLIAKPMPFKFKLEIRDRARAEKVARKWLELKMEGEFEDSRVFWAGGKSVAGNAEHGWGEVFA